MNAERYLQLALVAMVSLGALLLGMGQQNLWLPVLAIVAATTSYYFTDQLGWFRLPRPLANVVALFAVAAAIIDFRYQEAESKLIAIANLLVYLQCVLLYQQKHERTYWQLMVLSFLEVVVASALNLGMEYGLLLVLYSLVALSTMTLMFVYRESLPYALATVSGSRTSAKPLGPASVPSRELARRRPLAAFARTSSSEEPALAMLNRGLVLHVLLIAVATMIISILFFFFLPRLHRSQETDDGGRLTGFSEDVYLTEIGELLESPELVMRVKFYDPKTNQPYTVHGEPYFRGSVLVHYQRLHGHWRQPGYLPKTLLSRMQQPEPIGDLVLQRISLQPQRSRTLFAVSPAYRMAATQHEISWDPATSVLIRNEKTGDRYEYTLETSGFLDGQQVPLMRAMKDHAPGSECLDVRLNGEELATFVNKANEVVRSSGVAADDPYACAKALESHFHTQGQYTYSLAGPRGLPRNRDPIVEFLANGKTGHCEHFASALTLMLRTLGIPARIVLGYKGAEYNSVGNYYQVRQLHTHTWVEAYLRNDQVPSPIPLASDADSDGVWLRLDPTPAGDEDALAERLGLLERLGELRDYLQLLWTDYVLGLDSERQQEAVYDPFLRHLRTLVSPEAWTYFFRVLVVEMAQRNNWFSGRAALYVLATGFILVLLYRLTSKATARLVITLRRRLRKRHLRRARRVEFYQRLERTAARRGIRRAPSQTQREFAHQIACSRTLSAPLPVRITDAFYRVRFGGERLDREEVHQIEQALTQLEHELRALPQGTVQS